MPRGVAINVGANTNQPGFRGPIYADGSFDFVPIPETEPTAAPVPTYGDLPLSFAVPPDVRDVPVHLDPEFAEYGPCVRYTYGDPFPVKARPLLDLAAGDYVFFYATLDYRGEQPPPRWITADWGAYVIGRFELDRDPIPGEGFDDLDPGVAAVFASNAHVKRDTFDAAVLVSGAPRSSRLYEVAVPLSGETGTAPNRIVRSLSADSGRGPWWRRPLRFDAAGVSTLLELEDAPAETKAAYTEA